MHFYYFTNVILVCWQMMFATGFTMSKKRKRKRSLDVLMKIYLVAANGIKFTRILCFLPVSIKIRIFLRNYFTLSFLSINKGELFKDLVTIIAYYQWPNSKITNKIRIKVKRAKPDENRHSTFIDLLIYKNLL